MTLRAPIPAPLYADFRLHLFPDDRADVAAALDLRGAGRYIESLREHYFSAAFRALIASQRWVSVAIWEANGYRYARCRAAMYGDGGE
jgi:hypothetical protein